MTTDSTPDQQAAQKEALLLWIMITATPKYNPSANPSYDVILDGIEAEMQPVIRGWNWQKLTRDFAKEFAGRPFPVAGGPADQSYQHIINDFQAASVLTAGALGWPGRDSHPTVEEVANLLGIS